MKRNTIVYIYFVLGLLLVVSLFLWVFAKNLHEFGLNLFTELIGIIVTVFFVEKLFELNKLRENRPILAASYIDIRLLVNRYMSFFQDLYRNSVNNPEPTTLEELLKLETIYKIWENLDMNAEPKVFPKIDMWTYLQNTAKDFNELGAQILYRHGERLDPIVYKYVHNITESNLITSWKNSMTALKTVDIVHHYPRPKILAAYSILPSEDDLNSILCLYNWCKKTKVKIDNDSTLPHLFEYEILEINKRQYSYYKNPIELQNEIQIWEKFQGNI